MICMDCIENWMDGFELVLNIEIAVSSLNDFRLEAQNWWVIFETQLGIVLRYSQNYHQYWQCSEYMMVISQVGEYHGVYHYHEPGTTLSLSRILESKLDVRSSAWVGYCTAALHLWRASSKHKNPHRIGMAFHSYTFKVKKQCIQDTKEKQW